jgi:hypothetical protein
MLAQLKLRLFSVQISCGQLHGESCAPAASGRSSEREYSDVTLRSTRLMPRVVVTGGARCCVPACWWRVCGEKPLLTVPLLHLLDLQMGQTAAAAAGLVSWCR